MTYRDIATIEKSTETTRFRGEPVVILPLQSWKKVEEMMEEFEMSQSLKFKRSIKSSRNEIKKGLAYGFNVKTGAFSKVVVK
jgi:hypothetical protein